MFSCTVENPWPPSQAAGTNLGIGTGGKCPPKCPDCPTKHDAMQKSHISNKKKTTRILQKIDKKSSENLLEFHEKKNQQKSTKNLLEFYKKCTSILKKKSTKNLLEFYKKSTRILRKNQQKIY